MKLTNDDNMPEVSNYVRGLIKIRVLTGAPDENGEILNAQITIGIEDPSPARDFSHGTTADIRVDQYGLEPRVTLTQGGTGFASVDVQKKRLRVFQEAVRIAETLHYSGNPARLAASQKLTEDGYSFGIRRLHA
jgi:hypothetical protein